MVKKKQTDVIELDNLRKTRSGRVVGTSKQNAQEKKLNVPIPVTKAKSNMKSVPVSTKSTTKLDKIAKPRKGSKAGNVINRLISAKIASTVENKAQKKLNLTVEEYNKSIFHKTRKPAARVSARIRQSKITDTFKVPVPKECVVSLPRLSNADILSMTEDRPKDKPKVRLRREKVRPLNAATAKSYNITNCAVVVHKLSGNDVLEMQNNVANQPKRKTVDTKTNADDVYDFEKNCISESSSDDMEMKKVLHKLKEKIKKKRTAQRKKKPKKVVNRKPDVPEIIAIDDVPAPIPIPKITIISNVLISPRKDAANDNYSSFNDPGINSDNESVADETLAPIIADCPNETLPEPQNKSLEEPSHIPKESAIASSTINKITSDYSNQTANVVDENQPQESSYPPKSPWRLEDDEIVLPRTFYFARGKDLTPSYSSDIIPYNDYKPAQKNKMSSTPTVDSTRSLYNSNMENITPPQYVKAKAPVAQRFARSPLKDLDLSLISRNISFTSPLAKNSYQVQQEISAISKTNVVSEAPQKAHKQVTDEPKDNANYFGFDDDDETEDYVPIDQTLINKTIQLNRNAAKENLHKIKQLVQIRKKDMPAAVKLYNKRPQAELKNVFKSPTKPKSLKDVMLGAFARKNTSTPILSKASGSRIPSTGSDRPDLMNSINDMSSFNNEENVTNASQDSLVEHLFDEVQPNEISVTKGKKQQRYYTRKPRRKRSRNMYYQLLGLDDTDEESDDEFEEEAAPKRKRKKPKEINPEETIEFKKFLSEFNSMCEEVEQYNLIVEKV